MTHITPAQYRFIFDVFDERTFGLSGDLDSDFEVLGAGLDASLEVGAVQYDGRYGKTYSFYRVELVTFVEGGTQSPNDFNPDRFIGLYEQAS